MCVKDLLGDQAEVQNCGQKIDKKLVFFDLLTGYHRFRQKATSKGSPRSKTHRYTRGEKKREGDTG